MGYRRWKLPLGSALIVLVTLLLSMAKASPSPAAAPAGASQPLTTLLSGLVYEGDIGVETAPLSGVTLSLYCSNHAYPMQGNLVGATTTDPTGWYGLDADRTCEFYQIIETDSSGYTSVGATSVSGIVETSNWIEYALPLTGKTFTGNKFWDRGPATQTATRTGVR